MTSSPPKNDRPEGLSAPEARSPMQARQTVMAGGQHIITAEHEPKHIVTDYAVGGGVWAAWRDGNQDSGPHGFGDTEKEAIADLKRREEQPK